LQELRPGIDPGRAPVLTVLLLAQASAAVGDKAGAKAVLRQALAARPDQVALLEALGKLLARQGDVRLGEAVECYQAARALRPELGLALGGRYARRVGQRRRRQYGAIWSAASRSTRRRVSLSAGL
jgi:predicted Zn-dependent protease